MRFVGGLGYDGFETTILCLPLDDPAAFSDVAAAAGNLRLCGAHANATWWNRASAHEIDPLVERASRLPALGCSRLIVSMHPLPDPVTDEHLRELTANLARLGRACREAAGVQVLFHNHAGELADGARVLAAIVDRIPPEDLALGPDLGWVAHTGADPLAFLRRFAPRVGYLHLRDVTTPGLTGGFTEVNRGALPYPTIRDALTAAGYTGWLVAESEFGNPWHGCPDPESTARAQLDGLRAIVRCDNPSDVSCFVANAEGCSTARVSRTSIS